MAVELHYRKPDGSQVEFTEFHHRKPNGTQVEFNELWIGTASGEKKIFQKTLAAPTGLTVTTLSSSSLRTSWNAVSGASGYRVERSPDGSTGWTQVQDTVSTSWDDTGLTDGTEYSYRVLAYVGSVESGYSSVQSGTTTLIAPVLSTATEDGHDAADFTYNDGGASETGIQLWLSTTGPSSGFTLKETFPADSTADSTTGLSGDTQYWAKLRNVKSGVVSAFSSVKTFTTEEQPPGPVTNLAATPDCNSIFLTWDAAARADSYDIYRRDNGDLSYPGTPLANTAGLSYDDTSAVDGQAYDYKAVPKNTGGTGTSDEITNVERERAPISTPTTPTVSVAGINAVSVTLATSDPGITGWDIQRKRSGSLGYSDHQVGSNYGGGSPFTDSAFPDTNDGAWDLNDPPATPTVQSFDHDSITLSLPTDLDADSYSIDRKVGTGSWVVDYATGVSPSGTWQDTGLSGGTQYTYRIRALGTNDEGGYDYRVRARNSCGAGPWSAYSSSAVQPTQRTGYSGTVSQTTDTLSPPTAPTSVSVFDQSFGGSCSVQVSWTGATGTIDDYEIQRRPCGGSWGALATDTASPYDDTTVTCDVCYQYRVRARNSAGESAWTTSSEITPDGGGI